MFGRRHVACFLRIPADRAQRMLVLLSMLLVGYLAVFLLYMQAFVLEGDELVGPMAEFDLSLYIWNAEDFEDGRNVTYSRAGGGAGAMADGGSYRHRKPWWRRWSFQLSSLLRRFLHSLRPANEITEDPKADGGADNGSGEDHDGDQHQVSPDLMAMVHREYRATYHRSPPAGFHRWVRFAVSRKCSLQPVSYERIEHDLRAFRDAHRQCVREKQCQPTDPVITRAMLDAVQQLGSVDRISIHGGQVSGGHESIRKAITFFSRWLPDMELYVNMLDEPRILRRAPADSKRLLTDIPGLMYDAQKGEYRRHGGCLSIAPLMEQVCSLEPEIVRSHGFFLGPASFSVTDRLLPLFSSASIGACFRDILFPSHYYLKFDNDYYEMSSTSEDDDDADAVKWNEKKEILYWRGSSTSGCAAPESNYKQFHRQRFIHQFGKSTRNADPHFDIGFTSILQCYGGICEEEQQLYGPLLKQDLPKRAKEVKYLVDIDGNTFSQRFLYFLRHTGSLIFKVALFEDWLTDRTMADRHFVDVPVQSLDFALEETLLWAQTHDAAARTIAENAREYAARRLRYDDMLCHFYRLLLEYQQLLVPSVVVDQQPLGKFGNSTHVNYTAESTAGAGI